jgi:hypothetical protein
MPATAHDSPLREPAAAAVLVWFRRDLRDFDHAALYAALEAHGEVHCAFVFDTQILGALKSRADREPRAGSGTHLGPLCPGRHGAPRPWIELIRCERLHQHHHYY